MKTIKHIIKKYKIDSREKVIKMIETNPESLDLKELSKIAELVNNDRTDTAAYYTDNELLREIKNDLPKFSKNNIRILEPSVGIGNFINILIEKYKDYRSVVIDVVDIDLKSLKVLKALNQYRNIPSHFTINYINEDYLKFAPTEEYDLIIGNPPFYNMNIKQGVKLYRKKYNDKELKNISGFFLHKALSESQNVFFVMPKYLLHNEYYKSLRKDISKLNVISIIDFGEKGFDGVLIETIAILINKSIPNKTKVKSLPLGLELLQNQNYITNDFFPSWIIYRNDLFDNIANNLEFDVFDVFRDRQITNKVLSNSGDIKVLRSKNIKRDGTGFQSIVNYDKYTDIEKIKNFRIYEYKNNKEVYLCPNMTYYPRVIKKPDNTVVNGSIAILIPKTYNIISKRQLEFFASKKFEYFYRIARNHSTRSLNLDRVAIFYFGLLK